MTEPRGTSGAAAPLDREALESFWLEPVWEQAARQLAHAPHVIDIRNIGLLAAIDLTPRDGAPGARAAECASHCFEQGVLIRSSGDTLVLSPPLIIAESEVEMVFATIRRAIEALG
jgi:beta-alanine--pyruvate transaminase